MSISNEVRLTGRLTKDAEIKYSKSGTAISNLSIAVNRNVKDGDTYKEGTDFFEATLFGPRAEKLNQYLKKGTKVSILGELRQDTWVNNEGKKMYKISIIVNDIDINFQPKQRAQTSANTHNSANTPQSNPQANNNIPSIDIDDSEIPF